MRIDLTIGVGVVASYVEVSVLLLLLVHIMGVKCRIRIIYHRILSSLHHRVGKQLLYLEGLLNKNILHVI